MSDTTMHDELEAIKNEMAKLNGWRWGYVLGRLDTLRNLSTDCAPDVAEECQRLIDTRGRG